MKHLLAASLLLIINSVSNAQSEKLLLLDDFSNNNNTWPISNNDEDTYYLSDGKYVIGTGTKPRWCGIQQYIEPTKNWSISAIATHISGKNNTSYGLFFGAKDVINGYIFSITANGYYDLSKYDGKWNTLIEYKTSSSIKQGNNVENKIAVKRKQSTWEFYINDQYVASYPAQEFLGNYVGFFKQQQQQVEFDDLHIAVSDAGGVASAGNGLKELYNDDFSETTFLWDNRQTKSFTVTIKDGKLTHDIFGGEKAISSTRNVHADINKNYTIQLTATYLSGQANKAFGMIFGGYKEAEQHRFLITPEGSYSLYRDKTALINWTKSTAIKPGSDATNKLTLKKEGSQWKLYINDQWVNSTSSGSLPYTNVGAYTNNGLKVEYDNLLAYGYQEKEKESVFDDFVSFNDQKELPDYSKGKKLNTKGPLVQLFPKLVEVANENFEMICGSLRKDGNISKVYNVTLGLSGITDSYVTYNSMFSFVPAVFNADFGPFSSKVAAMQKLEELQQSFKAPYFTHRRIDKYTGLPQLVVLQKNSNGFTYFGSTIDISYDEKLANYNVSLKMQGKTTKENFVTISADASDNSTFSQQLRNVLTESKSGFKIKGNGMIKIDFSSQFRYYKTDLRIPGAIDCLVERRYKDDKIKDYEDESFEAYFEKDVSSEKANATMNSLLQKMTNALGSEYVYKQRKDTYTSGEVFLEGYDFFTKDRITSSFDIGVKIMKLKNDDGNYDVTLVIKNVK